ncbi:MAG: hypothetical protein KME17_29715 [Cyanosarcina radialis HA8281-LM2]|nr:hypothetical protein [Cyanosarcina radialis HA8281-LM2]
MKNNPEVKDRGSEEEGEMGRWGDGERSSLNTPHSTLHTSYNTQHSTLP